VIFTAHACLQRFQRDEVYYTAYVPSEGDGRVVLACMPLGEERNHTARTVHLFLDAAASRRLVGVMYDYPGMGESPGGTECCTLAAAVDAGEGILAEVKRETGAEREVFLGVRSGVFVARELYRKRGGRLLLWEPFLSGGEFIRELGLKEKIRGELTGGRAEEAVLFNGSPASPVLCGELRGVKHVFDGLDPSGVHVIHIGRGKGRYGGLPHDAGYSSVDAPPFWNPHEHWDTRACVEHTLRVLVGDESC